MRIVGNDHKNNLQGTLDGDHMFGLGADDSLNGYGGNDVLHGGLGNDQLEGDTGTDTLFGGAGDDYLIESDGGDTLYGGAGKDWLYLSYLSFFDDGHGPVDYTFVRPHHGEFILTPDGNTAYSVERLHLSGSNFNDSVTGGNGDDYLDGWLGDDLLNGGKGDDVMGGSNGNDTLYGGAGNDKMYGGGNDDILFGGAGDDYISGGGGSDVFSGHDILDGGAGADTFHPGLGLTDITYANSSAGVYVDMEKNFGFGGDAEGDTFDTFASLGFHGALIGSDFDDRLVGAQEIYGGRGDDVLVTGTETALMRGGAGRDTYVLHVADYQFGTPHIGGFNQAIHEQIDVSEIDARPHRGADQAFVFIGDAAFSGVPGEIRFEVDGDVTNIQLNTDHDLDAEFRMALNGVYTLTADDFIL